MVDEAILSGEVPAKGPQKDLGFLRLCAEKVKVLRGQNGVRTGVSWVLTILWLH